MKKLKLGKLKLASEEVLQRSQLSTIYGGSGGKCHTLNCKDATQFAGRSGECPTTGCTENGGIDTCVEYTC